MEFFDKLGKKASETYKNTTQKTSKIAREAKLKMSMNDNKSKIEELYEEIGKKIYMKHINSDSIDKDIDILLEEYCIQIDEICDAIEDERKELLTLKDKKECPNCFYEIELDYKYCPNCGSEQNDIEEKCNKKEDKEDFEDTNNEI